MNIVRTGYTIARPSCAPFLDPNTQVLFSGSIMCVRAYTKFTDPLPSISSTNRIFTCTQMLGSCGSTISSRSVWIPVHRQVGRYHSYSNRLIVKQRRHRNNPKLDRMLTSRELPSNVQTHDECNSNSYTSHYLLFCELRPNVVLASDEKPSSSLLPKSRGSAYVFRGVRVNGSLAAVLYQLPALTLI